MDPLSPLEALEAPFFEADLHIPAWQHRPDALGGQWLQALWGEGALAANPAWAYGQQVLGFYHGLLQACRWPVFHRGQVLGVSQDATGTRWRLRCPTLHRFDLQAPLALLEAAKDWVMRLQTWPCHPQALATVVDTLETEVVSRHRSAVPGGASTHAVCRAAWLAGLPCRHVGGGVFQLGRGQSSLWLHRSTSDRDSAVGALSAQNKWHTAQLLGQAGLPVPRHALVPDWPTALAQAEVLGYPLVLKPNQRDRAEGVQIGLSDPQRLRQAWEQSQGLGLGPLLLERQLPGVCHRLLVVGERVVHVNQRWPVGVCGDGQTPLQDLVSAAQQAWRAQWPWQRQQPQVPWDALAQATVAQQGWGPLAVPPPGVWVWLRPFESTAWGGTDRAVGADLHPENARVAVAAARLLRLDVAGVDMMATDLSRPWQETGAAITEVNFAPYLMDERAPLLVPYWQDSLQARGRFVYQIWQAPPQSGAWAQALAQAQAQARRWQAQGLNAYWTTPSTTEAVASGPCPWPADWDLPSRWGALVLDRQVQAVAVLMPAKA